MHHCVYYTCICGCIKTSRQSMAWCKPVDVCCIGSCMTCSSFVHLMADSQQLCMYIAVEQKDMKMLLNVEGSCTPTEDDHGCQMVLPVVLPYHSGTTRLRADLLYHPPLCLYHPSLFMSPKEVQALARLRTCILHKKMVTILWKEYFAQASMTIHMAWIACKSCCYISFPCTMMLCYSFL